MNYMDQVKVIDVYPYRRINGDIEFLLFHRSEGTYCENQWRMVGGKLENDETAWQAGLRELLEETGCQPVQYWTVPSLNHFYEAKHDRLMLIPVFAAELNDDDDILLNEEHDSCRWLQRDEAEQVMIWPEQIRLIALIDQILRFKTIPDEWIIK